MTQNNVQLQNGNGPLAGLRNQLINGNLEINQRGVTDITTNDGFMADRWLKGANSGFRAIVSNTVPDGFTKSFSLSGGTDSPMYQSVELPATGLAGQFYVGSQWTFSCMARCASGGNFRLTKRFVNGVDTNTTDETSETFVLDGTWTKVSFTFTISAAPNATNTSLQVIATSLTSNEVFCTGFQLEPGPIATPFEDRPIGLELMLCQRYFCSLGDIVASPYRTDSNTGARQATMIWPATMRTTPTVALTGTNNFTTAGASTGDSTAVKFQGVGTPQDANVTSVFEGVTGSAEL